MQTSKVMFKLLLTNFKLFLYKTETTSNSRSIIELIYNSKTLQKIIILCKVVTL